MSNQQSFTIDNKKKEHELWVERYRPKTLKDLIAPKRITDRFQNGLTSNVLLSGSAGTGKTTLAHILSQNRSVLFINASLNNGIDTVRNEIFDFVTTNSLVNHGQKKIVFLDEADNFTEAGQKSLRGFIEKFHKNALFVLTANFPEKIIDPLKSRLNEISFNFTDQEAKDQVAQYIKRIEQIVKHNGYQITRDAVVYLMKNKYPDMRGIIGDLQAVCEELNVGSVITIDCVNRVKVSKFEALYDVLITESAPDKLYSYIKSNFINKEIDVLKGLSSDFLSYLVRKEKHAAVLAIAAVSHRYNYESLQSIDKFITLLACCGAISDVLRKTK